jgi:hypothetical protein
VLGGEQNDATIISRRERPRLSGAGTIVFGFLIKKYFLPMSASTAAAEAKGKCRMGAIFCGPGGCGRMDEPAMIDRHTDECSVSNKPLQTGTALRILMLEIFR